MKRLLLLLTFLSLFISLRSRASHVMGAEITYKAVSNLKFEVTLKIYRDCRAIPLSNPGIFAIQCTSGGSPRSFSYSKVSIRDITPRCDTASGPVCNPGNTTISNEGIEEHTYKGVIDFNSGMLAADISNGCCEFSIYMDECCRNGATTTGSAGNFYVATKINVCKAPQNNSPQFTVDPLTYLCCNRPLYYNMGAIDTADGDSLSYALVPARENATTDFSYGSSYSYTKPLTPYLPGSPTQINPSANPPIGFFLDAVNGDLIFTPTTCGDVGPVVIAVSEYRKDSTGGYFKIGEVVRDLQFISQNCGGLPNNPPTISSASGYNYSVCEGSQICFTVNARDLQFIPPPPANPASPDSIDLTWNATVPGATFIIDSVTTVTGTGPKLSQRNARFCWVAPVGSARPLPYTFTVTASDNVCAQPAISTRAFTVRVKKLLSVNRKYEINSCARLKVKGISSDSIYSLNWLIKDSSGKNASLKHVDKNSSSKLIDSFYFKLPGKYIVIFSASNFPHNCSVAYADTIIVNTPLIVQIDSANYDTLKVCPADTVRLNATVLGIGNGPLKYKWFSQIPGGNDSSASFEFPAMDMNVILQVTDTAACSFYAQVTIKVTGKFSLGPDIRACGGDTVILMGPWGMSDYLWLPDSISSRNHPVSAPGTFVLQTISNLNCHFADTISFDTLPLPSVRFHGKDTIVCPADSILIRSVPGYSAYEWSNGSPGYSTYTGKPGPLSVIITDSNGCSSLDNLNIRFDSIPAFNFGHIRISGLGFSFSPSVNDSSYTYLWSFGDGNTAIGKNPQHTYTGPGIYTVCLHIGNSRGCSDTFCSELNTYGLKSFTTGIPLSIYPNPFSGQVELSAELPSGAEVSFAVYDLPGKELLATEGEYVNAGAFKKQLNLNSLHLENGMYILRVRIDNNDIYLRLIKSEL